MGKKNEKKNVKKNENSREKRSIGKNQKHIKEKKQTQSRKSSKDKSKSSNKNSLVRKKDVKMKFKYKHPKIALTLKIIFLILLVVGVVGIGVVAGLLFGLWDDDIAINMEELILKENSIIYDTDGAILAELNGDESRKIITLQEMSPYLPKAYIAIEDERFMTHHGVDIKRTGKAILSFVTNFGKSTAGGGSTITQQVVKNITKEDDASGIAGVIRKLKEWFRAYQIEDVLSKDQILELYLNLIYIGAGGSEKHGVEIGANYYFNKSANDLSIAQCAFLAGINHSPNRYNPYGTTDVTERITKRTKTVLSQMKKLGSITQEEYDNAIAEVEAGFTFENGVKSNVYSAHTDALITQLINQIMEEKQISKDAAETYLQTSGLKIYSTQITSIQKTMEEEVKKDKYKVLSEENYNSDGTPVRAQTAMVVIESSTGKVVGCIGQIGEKTTSRGQNRATQSTRSTGSAFKPLSTLVPGIEEGIINAATIYDDQKTTFNKGTASEYTPKNYNYYTTFRNVRSALTTSQNVPFVKIMNELGPTKALEYLKKMGITTLDDVKDATLPMAIGGITNGVSPLEMAAAYASIANNGTYIEPTFYSKVEDSDGKIVLEPNQKTEKVCSEDTAYVVKDLLTSVVKDSGATASYCKISGIDVAAKTGTSNGDVDRWLCGFTNYYSAATWFGFDKQEEVVASGNPAGKIWSAVMKEIHKGLPESKFEKTANIVTAKVCRVSGRLATSKCTDTYSEIFIKNHLPETCDAHDGQYTVCSESGLLPNEFCPANKLETKTEKYVVEKERLGLWYQVVSSTKGESAPTEYCTIHKKTEVVKPTVNEDQTESVKPKDETNEDNKKPSTSEPEEPDANTNNKPETNNGSNTGTGTTTGTGTGTTTSGETNGATGTDTTNSSTQTQ